jgi:hypothetical protein
LQKKLLAIVVVLIIAVSSVAAWQLIPQNSTREIRIGLVAPISGQPLGQDMSRAAQLAVDEINAAGGIYVAEWGTYAPIKLISIDTVERYQGSERETMILCLPFRKLASLKHMQSLSDDGKVDRKLNVALSRAKERLIVIGNSNLCRQTRHYQQLYENIRSRGQIINYQEIGVNHGKSSTSESA